MGLENLKSVFQEGLNNQIDEYSSQVPTNVNGTNFFNEPPQPPSAVATNPTDFSTANGNNNLPYTPLTQLGQSFMDGLSWESLYNPNHSYKDDAGHKGLIPINYPNASRDNFNILDIGVGFRTANIGQIGDLLSNASVENIDDFFTSRGVEPYIISQIGDRETTLGGRGLPVNRMVTDAIRLSKYLTSPSGLIFIGKQEALGAQGQKYRKFYNPLSTIISAGFRAGGGPASLLDRTQPNLSDIFKENEYPLFNPNAQPGGAEDGVEVVKSLLTGENLVESFSQGSPLGVNSLLNELQGNFQPLNFNLKESQRPRFGPFRPQSNILTDFQDEAKKKVEDLGDKVKDFFGQDTKKKKEKGESELEVAERYPNFNPSAEGESPLEYRGEDVEDDLDFADFNRFEDNFGPFSENDENYPNYNPAEEDISPLSRFGKNIEDDENFGRFTSTTRSPNVTSSLGPFNDDKDEFPPTTLASLGDSFRPKDVESDSGFGGDKHTLLQFGVRDNEKSNELDRIQYKENIEDAHPNSSTDGTIEGSENGMPFYFKDMRDGAFIFFRAYLEGLAESISPSWSPTNYMGRSEPVYNYERAEREINFNLKLFAQTKKELAAIYEKMNRLTSLCYPEYYRDLDGVDYGNRMKPPLTKLRIGEYIGTKNNEMLGFIKGLSYAVEAAAPFETEAGKRVPMYVNATVSYQIIHGKIPSLETQFYGYIGDDSMADPQNISERLRSGEDV